jgi:iron complex outermembrane receptor protein
MRSLARSTLLAVLLAAGVAHAQEQPESTEALPTIPVQVTEKEEPLPTAQRDTQRLEEIVVTATKREKSVREVPVTITALGGEKLERMGAKDIRDYIALVPGITLMDGETGEVQSRTITIRGVGPGQGANQTVGQFIGDVPMTDPYSNFITPDLDPYDLKTVEILKGPQGTYFGASALNGAIRYVPTAPELGHFGIRGFADYLSVQEGEGVPSFGGAVNVPLGETFALRGTGVLQRAPGVIDNLQRDTPDSDSRRKWSARVAARWEPTDRAQLGLMFLKQRTRVNDVVPVDNQDEELTNDSRPGPSQLESGFSLASLDARYRFDDWGTLIWQSSYQQKNALADVDTSAAASGTQGQESLRGYHDADISGWTHELRLVSADGPRWNWIAGVFMLDYEAAVETDLYAVDTAALNPLYIIPILGVVFTPRGVSYANVQTDPIAREISAYGELSRKFGRSLEITLGARFYQTRLRGTISYLGAGSLVVPDFDVKQDDRGISPKLSLTWKPWRHVLTYATVSRGYQFGGINASTSLLPTNNPATGSPPPPTYKSSSLWNREIGVRTDWLDRRLRADVTVFDLDWKDAQFRQYIDNLVVDNDYIDNVGKVRSQGVEGTLAWLTPLPGLQLDVATAYTRALTAASYIGGTGTEVPAGTEMPATPRWMTATTLAYNRTLGSFVSGASLTHTYSSKAFNNIFHEKRIYGFSQFNFNLTVTRPDWPLRPSLGLGVTNITDVRGVVGRTGAQGETLPGVTVTTENFIYVRPRALSARLALEF